VLQSSTKTVAPAVLKGKAPSNSGYRCRGSTRKRKFLIDFAKMFFLLRSNMFKVGGADMEQSSIVNIFLINHNPNSLAYGCFRGFLKKNTWTHVALRGNVSAPVWDLVKASEDAVSRLVCTRKKFFFLGSAGFLWVTS